MTQARLIIRPFAPADLPPLQIIRQLAFEPVFQSFREIVGEPIAAQAFASADAEQAKQLDDLVRPGSNGHVIVASRDGEIVGFVAYSLDRETKVGEIGMNAVDPQLMGRGIGSCMYKHVLACMVDAGMQVATVSTGGDPSHAAALRAYAKLGFNIGIPSFHLYKLLSSAGAL